MQPRQRSVGKRLLLTLPANHSFTQDLQLSRPFSLGQERFRLVVLWGSLQSPEHREPGPTQWQSQRRAFVRAAGSTPSPSLLLRRSARFPIWGASQFLTPVLSCSRCAAFHFTVREPSPSSRARVLKLALRS